MRLGKNQMKLLKFFHDGEMESRVYDGMFINFVGEYYFPRSAASRDEMRKEVFGEPTNNNCVLASQSLAVLMKNGLVEKKQDYTGGPDLYDMTIKGCEEYLARCRT